MDPYKNIEQRVEDGFIIDEHGRWVHMSQKGVSEKRFMEELEKGNVLLEGKWVPISEAKSWERPEEIITEDRADNNLYSPPPLAQTSADNQQETFDALETLLETKSIVVQDEHSENEVDLEIDDEQNETVYLSVEEVEKSSADDNKEEASEQKSTGKIEIPDEYLDNAEIPGEVEQELLFNWSRSAATEQSKYAMEYIDTLSASLKRRKIYQVLSIVSILIAVISLILLAFFQG
ncbi:MAG: hypothetical protein ACLFVQ_03810 [Chitinispirillaceae bacterium]